MTMEYKSILLIGGSGFIGSHIAHLLAQRGCNVTVPTRRRERVKHLILLPTTDVVEADVHDPAQLDKLMAGQDAVINLVGILHSRSGSPYGADFAMAHVELPRKIVAACRKAGVKRLLHISALKVAKDAPSQYLRSKFDGEQAIQEAGRHMGGGSAIAWTIFRPSIVFGPGDRFLNLFARLARTFPVLPLGCPNARFQPVFVEDVGASVVDSLDDLDSIDQTYELCGPKVYTLRELVQYVGTLTGYRRTIVGLPDSLAHLQALALELVPGKLMSRDNLRSMQVDNVCDAGCTLPFGREAAPLEAVAPLYLSPSGPVRAHYMSFRAKAGR